MDTLTAASRTRGGLILTYTYYEYSHHALFQAVQARWLHFCLKIVQAEKRKVYQGSQPGLAQSSILRTTACCSPTWSWYCDNQNAYTKSNELTTCLYNIVVWLRKYYWWSDLKTLCALSFNWYYFRAGCVEGRNISVGGNSIIFSRVTSLRFPRRHSGNVSIFECFIKHFLLFFGADVKF